MRRIGFIRSAGKGTKGEDFFFPLSPPKPQLLQPAIMLFIQIRRDESDIFSLDLRWSIKQVMSKSRPIFKGNHLGFFEIVIALGVCVPKYRNGEKGSEEVITSLSSRRQIMQRRFFFSLQLEQQDPRFDRVENPFKKSAALGVTL